MQKSSQKINQNLPFWNMPHFLYNLARLSAFTAQSFYVVLQSKYRRCCFDYVWASSGDFFNPPVYKFIACCWYVYWCRDFLNPLICLLVNVNKKSTKQRQTRLRLRLSDFGPRLWDRRTGPPRKGYDGIYVHEDESAETGQSTKKRYIFSTTDVVVGW